MTQNLIPIVFQVDEETFSKAFEVLKSKNFLPEGAEFDYFIKSPELVAVDFNDQNIFEGDNEEILNIVSGFMAFIVYAKDKNVFLRAKKGLDV
jgi:hypothetical protein